MPFRALRARPSRNRRPRGSRRLPMPKPPLSRKPPTVGSGTKASGAASRWRHRLGDPTARAMPAVRTQPRVPSREGVPQAHRQRRDRLESPHSRLRWAGSPQGRRTSRGARHDGQGLAPAGPDQQRDHHRPRDDPPFRPGRPSGRTASDVRQPARTHGSHGRRRCWCLAATVRGGRFVAWLDRHTTADRVGHHRWLAAGFRRASFSPVLATRLRGPPVCFDAPKNPPTTTPVRTHTPKPSSPNLSLTSSPWPAVNNGIRSVLPRTLSKRCHPHMCCPNARPPRRNRVAVHANLAFGTPPLGAHLVNRVPTRSVRNPRYLNLPPLAEREAFPRHHRLALMGAGSGIDLQLFDSSPTPSPAIPAGERFAGAFELNDR